MALDWDRLHWPEFVAGLEASRAVYSDDAAYLEHRLSRAGDIVLLLNRWRCRLPRDAWTQALAVWMRDHRARLERLETVRLTDDDFLDRMPEMVALYRSARDLKPQARTLGDTAASKFLHVLLPDAFVMWDNTIKRLARDYEDFLTKMHRLARRLTDESGLRPNDIEEHLASRVGDAAPRTLAKYLDEYNWYVLIGAR
jgi:hypothetical protein